MRDGHLNERVVTLIREAASKSSVDNNKDEMEPTPTSKRSLACGNTSICQAWEVAVLVGEGDSIPGSRLCPLRPIAEEAPAA